MARRFHALADLLAGRDFSQPPFRLPPHFSPSPASSRLTTFPLTAFNAPLVNTHRQPLRIGSLSLDLDLDTDGALCGVHLPITVPIDLDTATLAEVLRQLGGYRLKLTGTPFSQKVWRRMARIPWGSALTYGELAEAVGSPGGSRAVGRACATNPLPLIVPCHRVLAHEGMGGFGYGPEWKGKLLELETEPQP